MLFLLAKKLDYGRTYRLRCGNLRGVNRIPPSLALTIQAYINEELPIPYMVDVIDYNSLEHHELKEHINRVGVKFC